jgi:hypothetical protein
LSQPLAIAIAAAVVGPPIFALEAKMISSMLNFNNFPNPKEKIILTKTIIAQNTNNNGDFSKINGMDAGTPITTKKIYIKNVPISCDPLIFPKKLGK